jgi:Glycosyltransferase family 87
MAMSTPEADDRRATDSNSSFAAWSRQVVQAAAITRRWRPASARLGSWLDDLGSPPGRAGLCLALGLWLLIVVLSAPGQLWSAGQEAWCYWIPSILDPYRQSDWTSPVAYVYSPAFLEVIAPLRALSWTAFVGVWTSMLLGAVLYLTGVRLLWLGVLVAASELYGGNISLFLAVAVVLGFRWPATWAFVILTKVTPGIGLLWFALRREWRNLGIALAATAVVACGSALTMPVAWQQWVHVLIANAGRDGTWAAVPIALWIRLPIAVALVGWGATTDRRWTVPVASMLALPALWFGSLSMLLAVITVMRMREPSGSAVSHRDFGDEQGAIPDDSGRAPLRPTSFDRRVRPPQVPSSPG